MNAGLVLGVAGVVVGLATFVAGVWWGIRSPNERRTGDDDA